MTLAGLFLEMRRQDELYATDEEDDDDAVVAHPGHPDQKVHAPKNGMHHATDAERATHKIPPAWTNVTMSDHPDGIGGTGLVAMGYDAKGRAQYRYSAEKTEAQAAKKFARVKALFSKVDKLDKALDRDARDDDDAAAVLLIRRLGMRPGSTANTLAEKQAYGATTLQARHAELTPDGVRFKFTGKKGVDIDLTTNDPLVREVVASRLTKRSGDQPLFETSAARANAYMKRETPGFKLKDLRTVRANALALEEIGKIEPPSDAKSFEKARRRVGEIVSKQLGNTPAVALASYVNPSVFAPWKAKLAA